MQVVNYVLYYDMYPYGNHTRPLLILNIIYTIVLLQYLHVFHTHVYIYSYYRINNINSHRLSNR